jgi:AsmA protein
MRRRLVPFALALGLAALAVALAPWTVSTSALVARIDGQVQDAFGLDLDVGGRTTIAFLPVPRVKFEEFSLRDRTGRTLVDGGILRGELRVLPLLFGRLELAEVSLADAKIVAEVDAEGASPWQATVDMVTRAVLRGEHPGRSRLRRVSLSNTSLSVNDARTGTATRFDAVNLLLSQASPDGPADFGGSFRWRGELVTVVVSDLNLHAVANGRTSALTARLAGHGARLAVVGTVHGGPEPRVVGQSSLEVRSVRDLARWSGASLPLAPLVEGLGLDGPFEARRDAISWREVRLVLGADTLDGALMARLDRGRLSLSGTLAAEQLDLSAFVAPFAQAQTGAGGWSDEEIALESQTRADLDLRLSATAARAGTLRLEDLALSLLVRPGRVEASLGRATLNRGSLRARLALVGTPEGVDLRTQGTFERLDIGALLADLRQGRWIGGAAQGQFALEGLGTSPAALARTLHGRVGLTVRAGELTGIGLVEALRRVERRPLSASLDWRQGRTPFDQVVLQLAVGNGVAVVTECTVASPVLRGALQGRLGLVDRTVAARASFEATAAQPGGAAPANLTFDVVGPWGDVAVVPDARALIERSGAARSLLPDARIPAPADAMRMRESAAQ